MQQDRDSFYMQRCLDLAEKGRPHVRLNPLVGSCIVHQDRIIGEGFHQLFGGHHGEIEALNSVQEKDRHLIPESTLYVNLTPCNHTGKTPPCSQRILDESIKRVVIGLPEINDDAAGGSALLRSHGVEVVEGVMAEKCLELNRHFHRIIKQNRPFINLKWAQSSNGVMGRSTGRLQISNAQTQLMTHQLRAQHNAILVGAQTVRVDNPSLTTRAVPGDDPLRVVICGSHEIPTESHVLADGKKTVVFKKNNSTNTSYKNTQITEYQYDEFDLLDLFNKLVNLHHVGFLLIEGGANILNQFIRAGAWDACWRITSDQKLEGDVLAPRIEGHIEQAFSSGDDFIEVIRNPS